MGDSLKSFNDGIRQSAHADAIRNRRAERDMSPEQRQQSQLEAIVTKIATAVTTAIISKLTIKTTGTGGLTSSGSGLNLTLQLNMPAAPIQPVNGGMGDGQWSDTITDCDGNTFEVWIRNFTPPP